jgi:acyl-ACP thioesterase
MIEKFNADYRIPCYDTDLNQRLKPTAFLNMAQEAANIHADYLGVGYDSLGETHQAWVLSRMKVDFVRLPLWREVVNLKSWHKGANGFMFLRDFIMSDQQGEPLIKATTSWLVIDMNTRRLARRGASADFATDQSRCIVEDAIAEPAAKVVIPTEAELMGTTLHTVAFSDLDMNQHVNNVQYVVWAMDAVGLDITTASPLRELEINFNAEVRHTDVVEMKIYKDGTATYYVEGSVEGRNSFVVRLEF